MAQADSSLDATIRQAAQLVLAAEYVTALTGAGISVESGILPFRGPGGLWSTVTVCLWLGRLRQ